MLIYVLYILYAMKLLCDNIINFICLKATRLEFSLSKKLHFTKILNTELPNPGPAPDRYMLGQRQRRHPLLEAFAVVIGPTETRQRAGTPFAPYDIGQRPVTRSSHRAASSSIEAHV
jgi:hypothetical protein